MQGDNNTIKLVPSMIGTMSVIGGTAVGAPVDKNGFGDCLITLVTGAVFGSGSGSTVNLAVKIQESASADGTGASWSDINDGQVQGTLAFTTLTISGTDPGFQMDNLYENIKNRSRYLRAHATLTGTVGLGPKFSVNFLLGSPITSDIANEAVTQSTGNIEFTLLK